MNIFKKIGLLFKANKIVKEAVKMEGTKPGWQTSEFWITNTATLVLMYNSLFHKNIDTKTAAIIIGAMVSIYTTGRSVIKALKDIKSQYDGPPAAAVIVTPPAA